MICHTVSAQVIDSDPHCIGRILSHFGEEHHIKKRAGTLNIYAPSKSTRSMEQGKPFSIPESPLVDFDAVCQKVRAAVEPARTHAVSLHNESGDVLWLSESSMGPDEHNAVREALEAFSNINGPPVLAYDLGDSRSALLLRAVNARRALVGAVMVVMDTRGIKQDDKGAIRMMTPKLQRALSDFAAMRPDVEAMPALTLAPAPPARGVLPAGQPKPITPTTTGSTSARMTAPLELSIADSVRIPRPPATPTGTDTQTRAAIPQKRPMQTVTPEIDRLHAALRRSPIALHVQRLVPLTKGSQLKRYEVLLRSKSEDAPNAAPQAMLKAAVENGLGSMIDRRVVTELIGWLVHHPDVWQTHAVMFSVNLTTTALHDEHFIKFVGLCLAKSSLPKAMIAFEIDVTTAVKMGDKISEIAAALHRLGCPMVLDDFGMRTECFDLLRLPAVRYIKLAPEITEKMRSDKLSQAAITAVVQMARVLGMHTVAKRTETAAEQEWLTALGVDFIQSNAFSPSVAIETLSKR
jgi:EAL domain-containing protein (putative c-di-GMP-specific phosphodiesterase class I)